MHAQLFFQVMNILSALGERRVGHDTLLQRNIGFDAIYHHFAQRRFHPGDCTGPVVAVRDQFTDHRVVIRRHPVAVVNVGFATNAGPARHMELLNQAGTGHEGFRIFGVQAALDSMSGKGDLLLSNR